MDLSYVKEIFDPIYGFIKLTQGEIGIIDKLIFQRLHNINQLGTLHMVFPTARNTRFSHSIGVLAVITKMIDKFKKSPYWLKKANKNIKILCPDCKMDAYAKKFHNFVRNKGGHLLTPYKERAKPIKIKCKNNHVRETTPAAVYQGSSCQACKK